MRFLISALAVIASFAIIPSTRAAVASSVPRAVSSTADAHKLAQIIAPSEIMIPLNVHWGKIAILELPKNSAASKRLEEEYPGIHAAMWAASENELRTYIIKELPRLWSQLEKIYVADLSDAELKAVTAFYLTPTGQRLIKSLYASVDMRPAFTSVTQSNEGIMDPDALAQIGKDARSKAVAATAIDRDDILPLMRAISLAKLKSIGEKSRVATTEWVNSSDPAEDKVIEELMTAAVKRYVKDHPSKSVR